MRDSAPRAAAARQAALHRRAATGSCRCGRAADPIPHLQPAPLGGTGVRSGCGAHPRARWARPVARAGEHVDGDPRLLAGAVVALHTDVDVKLVSTVSGQTVWWVRPPAETTPVEHENLLHGEFFLRWRDSPDDRPLRSAAGQGCFVPCRWAHWLEHPGDEPVVSFEIGFWTYDSIRQRKVYDVNWGLRKAGLKPKPAGGPNDGLQCGLFDLASRVTGKVPEYRGKH